MMSVGVARPHQIGVSRINHAGATHRMISGTRRVRVGTVVVMIFLPPPLMIVSIMAVIFLPVLIVMVISSMVVVC